MATHELKNCSRCKKLFECKAGSITQCHCYELKLTAAETAFLEDQFDDCLCAACLHFVQQQFQSKTADK